MYVTMCAVCSVFMYEYEQFEQMQYEQFIDIKITKQTAWKKKIDFLKYYLIGHMWCIVNYNTHVGQYFIHESWIYDFMCMMLYVFICSYWVFCFHSACCFAILFFHHFLFSCLRLFQMNLKWINFEIIAGMYVGITYTQLKSHLQDFRLFTTCLVFYSFFSFFK